MGCSLYALSNCFGGTERVPATNYAVPDGFNVWDVLGIVAPTVDVCSNTTRLGVSRSQECQHQRELQHKESTDV